MMPKARRGTLGPPALPGILHLPPGEVQTLGNSLVSHCMRNSNGHFVLLYLGAHVGKQYCPQNTEKDINTKESLRS